MNAGLPILAPAPGPVVTFVRRLTPALLALVLSGCATTTEVKVDSLAKPNAEAAVSYQIRNKNPALADDSLRYQEASGLVRTALAGRGLYEAPAGVKPDLIVDLEFGLGAPVSRRETVSEPVYVNVPGRLRTERVQVGTDAQGRPVFQTVTVQEPPSSEFAGYREYQVTVTVYEKFLRLAARENRETSEGRPPAEVWTVDVTAEGESRDLRKSLPVLVAASIDFVGRDSKGQKTLRIKDSDKDIAYVKQGL